MTKNPGSAKLAKMPVVSDPLEAEVLPAKSADLMPSIDVQSESSLSLMIAQAERNRRNLASVMKTIQSEVGQDMYAARRAVYILKRGGSTIYGPSIRLAEMLAYYMGNIRLGAKFLERTDKAVTAVAFAHDLERNMIVYATATRPIVRSDGTPYSEDMVSQTMMAAQSIALRNAVLRVVPRHVVEQIVEGIIKRISRKVKDPNKEWQEIIREAKSYGISESAWRAKLGMTPKALPTAQNIVESYALLSQLEDHVLTRADFAVQEQAPEAPKAPQESVGAVAEVEEGEQPRNKASREIPEHGHSTEPSPPPPPERKKVRGELEPLKRVLGQKEPEPEQSPVAELVKKAEATYRKLGVQPAMLRQWLKKHEVLKPRQGLDKLDEETLQYLISNAQGIAQAMREAEETEEE